MQLAAAAQPDVGVVVYDWRLFTLQELFQGVKRVLGQGTKVKSVAVAAPGNRPGTVGEWGTECVNELPADSRTGTLARQLDPLLQEGGAPFPRSIACCSWSSDCIYILKWCF